jgi:NAD(P)-dependent dehydrogenase (short-subunit alcohol dehydrogenase family)
MARQAAGMSGFDFSNAMVVVTGAGAYASGRVGASHYCASKAGVVMFTRVLAMELAEQRINVNCIDTPDTASIVLAGGDAFGRNAVEGTRVLRKEEALHPGLGVLR